MLCWRRCVGRGSYYMDSAPLCQFWGKKKNGVQVGGGLSVTPWCCITHCPCPWFSSPQHTACCA